MWRRSVGVLVVAAAFPVASRASADDAPAPASPPNAAAAAPDDDASPFGAGPTAPATIRAHQYSLAECLALADRNFPNLWAARARLAFAHGQLEETRWTPWFQWSASSTFGVAPPVRGTVVYPLSSIQSATAITSVNGLQGFLQFGISGTLPLYTFGKIESSTAAAVANVRLSEWDMERWRQLMRMDVRRAYYGLQLARDAKDVVADARERMDKALKSVKDRLAKGDAAVSEIDRLRIEGFREELIAQSLQAPKGEAYGLAALRYMTGVAVNFDVPDEPLERPTRYLGALAQYVEAARVLRPDVNMARAGLEARKALGDYNRARLFPDLGLGLGADFHNTPSAIQQNNAWASDPYNHFYYYFGFGLHWSLDLLPQAARIQQAESQIEESRALERLALANATYEVERAYADTVEAAGREEAWGRAEHIAKQWISTVQDAIDLGTNDERGLLEPLRIYGNDRIQHLYALMDLNVAMSNLALTSGWDSAAPEN
jgi:multidrug efflux system outer membrane protein